MLQYATVQNSVFAVTESVHLNTPLKKEAQQLGKARRLGKDEVTGAKNPLPSPIQCAWDTMGCVLTDGTPSLDEMAPGQMGRGLRMAHHYRTPGVRNKVPLRAGGPPSSQAGLRKAQMTGSLLGETNGLPESIGWLWRNAKR
jgi:hypothetical protein